jgi:hypothetical protein
MILTYDLKAFLITTLVYTINRRNKRDETGTVIMGLLSTHIFTYSPLIPVIPFNMIINGIYFLSKSTKLTTGSLEKIIWEDFVCKNFSAIDKSRQ